MIDVESWIRLIDGIYEATRTGRLRWDEKTLSAGWNVSVLAALSRPKAFTAVRGTTAYEIASASSFARAPFELSVWDMSEGKMNPLGTIGSSTAVDVTRNIEVNRKLEDLFNLVAGSAVQGSQIVDRLLGELGTED